MPSISSCPQCHRDLTIPDLAEGRQLRCPLCDAQFAAESVLADSVSFPPAAIVVGADDPPQQRVAAPDDAFSDTPAGAALDALASPSPLDAETPADQEPPAANWIPETPPTNDAGSRFNGLVAESETAAAAPGEAASDYESFGRQAAAMHVAPQVRRQASPFGVLGQLLGMALGGVVGLAIGYYVLIWIGGPRADFLELRSKLPQWLLPAARRRHIADETAPFAATAAPQKALPSDDGPASPVAPQGEFITDPAMPLPLAAGKVDRFPPIDLEPTPREAAPAGPASRRADEILVEGLPGPKPLPKGYRGPRGFKLRTGAELEAALDKAEHALRCPHCLAPGAVQLAAFAAPVAAPGERAPPGETLAARHCDYCRGKPVLGLTTAAFEQVCELAEAITFVRFDGDEPRPERCRDAAEMILLAIGGQRDKSEIAGRLAGARLDDSQRPSNGIVLAGTVQQVKPEGELFAIQLLLFGSGKPVTVISRQPPAPPVARRDRLIVVGSIVDSPRDNLAGYEGDLPQVVWGGLPLKVAAASR